MWIITGLGNPGRKYAGTRHNIGFRIVDRLADQYGIQLTEKELFIIGRGTVEGKEAVLLEPLTFMNRSGLAVNKIIKKFVFNREEIPDSLIVVHDDLDIGPGLIKIRRSGSSGGHKGIESIIQEIGTKDFIRVKAGIGRPEEMPVDKYVLGKFSPAEKKLMDEAVAKAADAVSAIISKGIDKAMNAFNRSA